MLSTDSHSLWRGPRPSAVGPSPRRWADQQRVHAFSGLTLLEMLVSMALLAGGLVSISYAFSTAMQASHRAECYAEAMLLAQQKLAALEAARHITYGTDTGDFDAPFDSYAWVVTLSRTDDPGIAEAAIVIEWKTGRGPMQYQLNAVVPVPSGIEG